MIEIIELTIDDMSERLKLPGCLLAFNQNCSDKMTFLCLTPNVELDIEIVKRKLEFCNIPAAITDRNKVLCYVNHAWSLVTGYLPSDVIGKTPAILQGVNTSKRAIESIRESIQQDKPWRGTIVNYKKTGEMFWKYLNIAPLSKGYWIGCFIEITHYNQTFLTHLGNLMNMERTLDSKILDATA